MADHDFDFGVRERRETKRFEPPPWERDQFEELARKRADEEAAEAKAAAERSATQAGAAEAEAAGQTLVELSEETPSEAGATAEAAEEPAVPAGALEDARVMEMLTELASEEPPASRGLWKVSVAIGGVMVALGAVFLFWGMAALVAARRAGAVGTFGGIVLLLFGAGFVAGGAYLAVKNLRQQGVL